MTTNLNKNFKESKTFQEIAKKIKYYHSQNPKV